MIAMIDLKLIPNLELPGAKQASLNCSAMSMRRLDHNA
jgi:hypothetical protein